MPEFFCKFNSSFPQCRPFSGCIYIGYKSDRHAFFLFFAVFVHGTNSYWTVVLINIKRFLIALGFLDCGSFNLIEMFLNGTCYFSGLQWRSVPFKGINQALLLHWFKCCLIFFRTIFSQAWICQKKSVHIDHYSIQIPKSLHDGFCGKSDCFGCIDQWLLAMYDIH